MEKTSRKLDLSSTSEIGDGDQTLHHQVPVDWRGRPCRANRHGGMTAAIFVLGLQAFEMMAIAGVGNNLITYVFSDMHFPLSKSANIVTNFVGTIFLLSLLGGFLSDSYLGSFWTMLVFGFVELAGFILLSIQAHLQSLKPPKCNMTDAQGSHCEEASGYRALIFYVSLCLVALGSGCLKPNIISHGADQFRREDSRQSRRLSTYFNAAYFAFCTGELVALTVLVWVQTDSGMDVGFGVSAAAMVVGLVSLISGILFYKNTPPHGSIFTPIAQVFVAAITKRKQICPSNTDMLHGNKINESNDQVASAAESSNLRHTEKFRFLDKAIPYLMLIVVVPLYETLFVPITRRLTGRDSGISPLQRVGIGLFIASFSMVSAALVEKKRRDSALQHHETLSIFWIAPQFLIFGLSEMFTAVGLIEFFYKQSVEGMQSFLTAMTYCSYSFGFYLSSLLVSLVNKITSTSSSSVGGWLSDNDLNKDRLDLFYWLLAALSFINFLNYLFCSLWYSNKLSPLSSTSPIKSHIGGDAVQRPQLDQPT
ncbi:hypothetical protein EUGRSUZ_F04093 [Eucalyptus grandis]|uniref:Uncharacterized protein n=2 Tax=Eucalyptus grandis TaxID=71139 RepID=A0ACC3KNM8_EUCGR|nr:hypothetical protein EUGRSUZ_F04093 [Eucalyptus grandis]